MWAALFPGQGSQTIGMGQFLFENFTSTQRAFEEASDTLKIDFKRLCFEGPESDLALTENTQPCLLLVSYATFLAVQEVSSIRFQFAAGHSVGEYAALATARAMTFADALQAVRIRGQAMQKAVPVGVGGMIAVIGLADAQVLELCRWVENESGFKPLEPANFNATGQVVVSGSAKAIEWLRENFKPEIFNPPMSKVRLFPLNVSAPFHCSLMKPAEEQMAMVLKSITFQKPTWPIVQNISAEPVEDPTVLRENLVRQITGSVRWTQCMKQLQTQGITRTVELGAGKVLAGLAKKIDSLQLETFNINSLDDLKKLETLS